MMDSDQNTVKYATEPGLRNAQRCVIRDLYATYIRQYRLFPQTARTRTVEGLMILGWDAAEARHAFEEAVPDDV